MQNMIQLPQDLYDAVRKKAAAQQKTTDALVTEWVSEHLDESETSEMTQAFEQEVATFEQMRADLLTQYAGQFVAIYQGKVVASGSEKLPRPQNRSRTWSSGPAASRSNACATICRLMSLFTWVKSTGENSSVIPSTS